MRYFFWGSFNDMLFLSCVCFAFMRVCWLMFWGHLLGKGWPLGSRLCCLMVSLLLSRWYPGSGVVLDCIDSWYLPSFLLWSGSNCWTYWWYSRFFFKKTNLKEKHQQTTYTQYADTILASLVLVFIYQGSSFTRFVWYTNVRKLWNIIYGALINLIAFWW